MPNTKIREKIHRLPTRAYHGEMTVSVTMCVKARKPLFIDAYIVTQFVRILENAARRWSCWVIYCFMPDHLHLVIHGSNPDANLWRMLVEFKQKTGFWLSKYHACGAWQKDFHDHVIRKNDDLSAHVRYVLENPWDIRF